MDSDQRIAILENARRDFVFFCRTFFNHRFKRPFAPMHFQMMDAITDETKQRIAISAPRGIGKTTILKMLVLWHILYRSKKMIVIISDTADLAVAVADDIKYELDTNEMIAEFWPDMRSKNYSKLQWETSFGTKVLPRGAKQQIRGQHAKGGARPDLIILDDIENDENVKNEDRRKELKGWFYGAAHNCVDQAEQWQEIAIGTILHSDSLLVSFLNDKTFFTLKMEMCNDKLESQWPEYISTAKIRQIYADAKESETLTQFYMEMRGICLPMEDRLFHDRYFQDYADLGLSEVDLNNRPEMLSVVMCDPARISKEGSADTAITGVSIDTKKHRIFIRDIVAGKMTPVQMHDGMIDMAERINAAFIAPETTGLESHIIHPLIARMAKRRVHCRILEIKPKRGNNKVARATALSVLYRDRMVYHNRVTCAELENQLLVCPMCKWDIIDTVSGLVQLLDDFHQYFFSDDQDDIDKEFEELQREEEYVLPALGDSWRRL